MSELTDKQEQFCQEYIKDCNATQAAIRAGYSEDTARSIGSENLSKPAITERLAALQAIVAERNGVDQDWIITRLKDIVERCRQAEPVLDAQGVPTGEYVFNAAGANKALELLGRTLALFIDKSESTVTHVSHEDALAQIEKDASGHGTRAPTTH